MLFRNIVLLFLLMVKHHQCQIFRQNTIVFPKIVKRFKRDINAVSNGIQLDIDGQNESENFSLYLKKNANLGYFYCISSRLKPTTKHHVCFVHLIFGFWSLLATKLRKYKNVT